VLDRVAGAVEREVAPVLADTLQGQAGQHIFNFVANSVLAEVDARLVAAFPGKACAVFPAVVGGLPTMCCGLAA
jgi:hypothetical protein